MTTYAEVAINAPVRATFAYHIPDYLAGLIAPGRLVQVAFGPAQQVGVVLALHESSPVHVTKPIRERLDPRPVLTPLQIGLARWLSEITFAPADVVEIQVIQRDTLHVVATVQSEHIITARTVRAAQDTLTAELAQSVELEVVFLRVVKPAAP